MFVDVAVMWIPRYWLVLRSRALIWHSWRSRSLILQLIGSAGITHVLSLSLFIYFRFSLERLSSRVCNLCKEKFEQMIVVLFSDTK